MSLATVLVTSATEQTLSPSPVVAPAIKAASKGIVSPSPLGTFQFLPSPAECELMFRLLFASATGSMIGFEVRSYKDLRTSEPYSPLN